MICHIYINSYTNAKYFKFERGALLVGRQPAPILLNFVTTTQGLNGLAAPSELMVRECCILKRAGFKAIQHLGSSSALNVHLSRFQLCQRARCGIDNGMVVQVETG